MKKIGLRWSLITGALLYVIMFLGSSPIETTKYWRSSDGAVLLSLHDKWNQTRIAGAKEFDPYLTSKVIPGSDHALHVGGILQKRYISFSVYSSSSIEGNKVEQVINLVSQQLREQNCDVIDVHFDKQGKGYIFYRFTHTGDPVSQVLILVGVSTGQYAIEINAPRRDEEKLKEEALKIFSNLSILKPYK